ncbi:MAG: polysaccharide lyase domain-containing protein [Sulfuriferula sp.]
MMAAWRYVWQVVFIIWTGLAVAGTADARTINAGPDNYHALLNTLQPGDQLQLAAGDYRNGLPIHHLSGLPDHPIIITGPLAGRAVFHARANANTVSIVDSAYIEIRDLLLDGNNLPVDGVRAEGHAHFAHHITLTNLLILGHGNNQQTVGISTKCPAWAWVIRDNVIVGAGTGMYLGNSDGSDAFVGGVIEYNYIADTLGYNLQIKHQIGRTNVPGMPVAAQQTIIRHNVFSKAKNGSSGQLARPNVLVGHWPLAGNGVNDSYLIYANFFYDNPTEALFQGEGNIALYNNIFVNPAGDAVHIQPHHDIPKHIVIAYNTIVASGDGVRLLHRPDTPAADMTFTHNLIFAGRPVAGLTDAGNLVQDYASAKLYLRRPYATPPELDVAPKHRLRVAAERLSGPFDLTRDYARRRRNLDDMGALSSSQLSASAPLLLQRPHRK